MSRVNDKVPQPLLPPAKKDTDSNKENVSLVQGALKLETSISTPVVSAGEEFSIYVVIRNPFSESVTVYRTETHIPIKLSDEIWRKRYGRQVRYWRQERLRQINDPFVGLFDSVGAEKDGSAEAFERKQEDATLIQPQSIPDKTVNLEKRKIEPIMIRKKSKNRRIFDFPSLIGSAFLGLLLRLSFWFANIWMFIFPESGPRVAVAVGPEERRARNNKSRDDLLLDENLLGGHSNFKIEFDEIDGDLIANLTGRNNNVDLSIAKMRGDFVVNNTSSASEMHEQKTKRMSGNEVFQRMEDLDAITLSPGDSLVKHFVLRTRGWLTFTPIAYTFQIQVRYMINEQPHVDTVPFSLNIRAPMEASIIGSIIGSIFGYIVSQQETFTALISDFDPQKLPNVILTLVRTVIFALIIIVAFARKSTVQQIVSVEDFWGGIFISFLVGYSGESFIQQFINTEPGNV